MANANALQPDLYQFRELSAIPRVDEFYNQLFQRLSMSIGRFYLSQPFTMFINALPRRRDQKINRFENLPLIYAGIPKQRELLEGPKRRWKADLDEHWNHLDITHLSSETAVVSSQLFKALKQGIYRLQDIEKVGMGSLVDYFGPILKPESSDKEPTSRQVAEYHILREFFDIEQYNYLSIPLIQFGEFDGIIHLVYNDLDKINVNIFFITNFIKACSMGYEQLMLDWDLLSRDPERKALQLLLQPIYYDQINRNPILRELEYDVYYHKHVNYLRERMRLNDIVIHSKFFRPYLKTAIISIMIDSYAHNISAHSLVALNWWFKRRAESLNRENEKHFQEVEEIKEIIDDGMEDGFDKDRLLELISPWMSGHLVKEPEAEYDVVKYPGSLAREIQPLLKFLMQKGAFWSGIARDNQFGGESRDMFGILWEEFINNPLYLGTIAKSEDIHKITIRVILYEPAQKQEEESAFISDKKVLVEGDFVTIDIKHKRPAPQKEKIKGHYHVLPNGEKIYFLQNRELESMSGFVHPQSDYIKIKELLESCQAFFPGEVVGRHSFFTILENEIRNVKHFKGAALKHIQDNGLTLNVSLQECNVIEHSESARELYKVGIWIGTATNLKINDQYLIRQKYEALSAGVMDEDTFAPRLGGNYQDKICAAMLFNNSFDSVQRGDSNFIRDKSGDTLRDRKYYPWIIPATSTEEEPHRDFELSSSNQNQLAFFRDAYAHRKGFFKKYFHIWKASDIRMVKGLEDTNFIWENLARFRFVVLQTELPKRAELWKKVRQNGVIRIVDHSSIIDNSQAASPEEITIEVVDAYKSWLNQWMSENTYKLTFLMDGAVIGQFEYNRHASTTFRYYNTYDLKYRAKTKNEQFEVTETLQLAHGGHSMDHNVLRYRSHGIFRKYFMKGIRTNDSVPDSAYSRLIELFEILSTRITIFDNRIRHRIRYNEREKMYQNALKLVIRDEAPPELDDSGNWCGVWEDEKTKSIPESHFLILHLSFIEKILISKYSEDPDYSSENIGLFIEKEILPLVQDAQGQVKKNFILIITTGRGRTKWWTKLNEVKKYKPYTSFTMFRPVESLISGVEDALSRKDDIELKYNLVSVLFGT